MSHLPNHAYDTRFPFSDQPDPSFDELKDRHEFKKPFTNKDATVDKTPDQPGTDPTSDCDDAENDNGTPDDEPTSNFRDKTH
ncbi:MAG: hypothetical protein A2563_03235 [Candidatus Magasanikbacteria bacterium RIFOXYD1_FULL_40_23]|uniref:Uncharacterized protein n=1 Tax=Candidatus Magasanikbacteria bacterium RIFOXYD1_FULL_40_23 TaxID=1798705 RepID=A0A1F6P929_9BACT|nr:MAG: hypothetical protein A2563_03235 [Candidatus Magasanikbacteria bacterium RIFOXYD1_FULL_40_23]